MVQLTPNKPHITLRVKFKKVGSLQYISHLDLVRTMNKIIVRAGLPLWYTEGFNPKPKMIFAAPLSIGTESLCEFMDLRLIDDIPPEEAMARLNANMTEEMQVIEAYYTE
ncbi:MAG: TIGR03936 family radical SAM-associated protein, partial [Clostridia bacterium]|nr:TIGR03936 family radical SAM-associated protein [Clostridia bacterium]